MKKSLVSLILVMSLMMAVAAPLAVSAQSLLSTTPEQALKDTGGTAYGQSEAPQLLPMIGKIIKILLTLLGVLFLVLVVYAGFLWMTAGGDKEKVDKAQDILKLLPPARPKLSSARRNR